MSPPDAENRPGEEAASEKVIGATTTTIAQVADVGSDIMRELAQWEAAYKFGYLCGKSDGYKLGRHDEYVGWAKIFGIWRQVVKSPTFAELQVRRGEAA